jgi:adenosylcobinamide amidohydrolase
MHDESRNERECYEGLLEEILFDFNLSLDDVAYISTGVSMSNLALAKEEFEDLWVICMTTAGCKNNAMRIGVDRATGIERNGRFTRFGTINNVVLTNASLSTGALASSIITVTEAKNVALQELDIKSSFDPGTQATGTGTDQVIVIPGNGEQCTYCQGHTKIGEMIARTVTRSTITAIRQSIARAS